MEVVNACLSRTCGQKIIRQQSSVACIREQSTIMQSLKPFVDYQEGPYTSAAFLSLVKPSWSLPRFALRSRSKPGISPAFITTVLLETSTTPEICATVQRLVANVDSAPCQRQLFSAARLIATLSILIYMHSPLPVPLIPAIILRHDSHIIRLILPLVLPRLLTPREMHDGNDKKRV